MLNITVMNRFYNIRNFTDMHCKYSRIQTVSHRQLCRVPESYAVFIVMAKNYRLVRIFSFNRLFCLCDKFCAGRLVREGG